MTVARRTYKHRIARRGAPHGPPSKPLHERLAAHVNRNGPIPIHRPELGPCHIWTGATTNDGYGKMGVGSARDGTRRTVETQRVAFFVANGRWPTPEALHLCDNPPCVKAQADDQGPAHIIEGTRAANMRDCASKDRNGSQTHPERRPRGDTHHTRQNPLPRTNGAWRRRDYYDPHVGRVHLTAPSSWSASAPLTPEYAVTDLATSATATSFASTCDYFNNACAYCLTGDTILAKEHVIARSRGGTNAALNIVPACIRCNSDKGAGTVFKMLRQLTRP
jgi:5-methylcytosine-specific restriction endonuclease McrA